ncbi:proline-specific peptidase [Boletus edulis BED1]|uniref:Proline-specific peptidase n=1 Tax=Boletus edulis BED1 TaxID=1328754 RepID=A0AAD4GAX6_BOLED|nr:proline-specific peptidase [Boletus edulis BED1]
MSESTGKVDFRVGNETYQTWYKIFGDLNSGIRPVVMLHGGPGLSHHYVLPYKDLHTRFNIPVIFYDQIGIGESSHPKDVPKEFWTVELFMDELDNILERLGIKDFDLAGHSWGGMLAAHYVSHRHPPGLRRLVLASAAPSMALWVQSTRQLLQKLPENLRETIEKHEREGSTDDPEYQAGMNVFYAKHVCKITPWPEELGSSFAAMQADPIVYSTMLGPSEFTIVGTLKDWSCLDQIHTIDCPTLLTNGADDEAQDVAVQPFFAKIPKVRWVTFANSSHMAFFEERDRYFEIVGKFLTGA